MPNSAGPQAADHKVAKIRLSEDAKVIIGFFIVPIVIVLVWAIGSKLIFVIPDPISSVKALASSIADGSFYPNFVATIKSVIIGFVIALVGGFLGGLALGLSKYWRSVLEPLILAFNSVPKIIFFPILLSVFRIGLKANIANGAIHGIFPITINVMAAVANISQTYLKVGRVFNLSPWQMFTKIYLPATIKPLATGIRLSFSSTTVGVVLAEIFSSQVGLGRVITHSYSIVEYSTMFGTMLFLFVLATVLSIFFWRLEKWTEKIS